MWKWSYAADIAPQLLKAFLTTIGAALSGFALAAVIGLLMALLVRSGLAPVRLAAKGVVEFIRRTPLLVQLFFLYYSLPMLTSLSMSAYATGVIGLGLHYGTYLSEIYRSGIDAVPKGQWEAARALNLSRSKTWFGVILPQAIPPIIPMMGNYLIVIVKETPTLSAITLVEVLLTAKNTASVTYRVFEPYTIAGLLFLLSSLVLSLGVTLLDRRLRRSTAG